MIRTMVPLATADQVRGLIEGNAELFGARAQNLRAWSMFGRINAADTMSDATTTTPPPAAEYMYIEDINMYARGPHLNIDVTIRWDSDGSGTVTPGDAPAVGAILYVALCGNINLNDPCNFKSTAVATDASGQASYKARGATGIYYFGITDIQHDQYDWNAAWTQGDNPASYSF